MVHCIYSTHSIIIKYRGTLYFFNLSKHCQVLWFIMFTQLIQIHSYVLWLIVFIHPIQANSVRYHGLLCYSAYPRTHCQISLFSVLTHPGTLSDSMVHCDFSTHSNLIKSLTINSLMTLVF